MIVYKAVNTASNKVYYGITTNMYARIASHKYKSKQVNRSKPGGKTPFYDAIRKYGWDEFEWVIIHECSLEEAQEIEIKLISIAKNLCYNLHEGGTNGFSMRSKSAKEYISWRNKLKLARKGRKPSLGMKHTDKNKKLFSQVSNEYWATQYKYPDDVLNYSFKEANIKYGISKTHYYRKKRALTND